MTLVQFHLNVSDQPGLERVISEVESGRFSADILALRFQSGLLGLRDWVLSQSSVGRGDDWFCETAEHGYRALALCHVGARAGQAYEVVHELLFPRLLKYNEGGVFRAGLLPRELSVAACSALLNADRSLGDFERGVLHRQIGLHLDGLLDEQAINHLATACELLRDVDSYFCASGLRQLAMCYSTSREWSKATAAATEAFEILLADPEPTSRFTGFDARSATEFLTQRALPALLVSLVANQGRTNWEVEAQRILDAAPLSPEERFRSRPGFQLAEALSVQMLLHMSGGIDRVMPMVRAWMNVRHSGAAYPLAQSDLMYGNLSAAVVAAKLVLHMTESNGMNRSAPGAYSEDDIRSVRQEGQFHFFEARKLVEKRNKLGSEEGRALATIAPILQPLE